MKTLRYAAAIFLVFTLAFTAVGCSGMTKTQQTTLSGGAIGAAGGALLGAIAGNAAIGAAVGGGVGLLGGYLYGESKK